LVTLKDGLPTTEVYEVFCDSKGFLWIGHSLGLSRYDGNRFTHYNNSSINNLGFSDIKEDKLGTIWCRNFGGQIFYIQNNQMKLLEAYNWKQQNTFPKIFIDESNQLIATDVNGIFIYNIQQQQNTIVKPPNANPQIANYSLGLICGKVICIWYNQVYLLQKQLLMPVTVQLSNNQPIKNLPIILGCFRDTVYLSNSKKNIAVCCVFKNNTLTQVRSFAIPSTTYAILPVGNNKSLWLCGSTLSYNLTNAHEFINNTSVSSVTVDKENNLWFSSLQDGLGKLVETQKFFLEMPLKLNETEVIKDIDVYNKQLLVSTSIGNLFFLEQAKTQLSLQVKDVYKSSLNVLKNHANKNLYVAGTYLFKYNARLQKLDTILKSTAIKDVVEDNDGNVYLATSHSLLKFSTNKKVTYLRSKRCLSVTYANNTLYGVFSDGVFSFNKNGIQEVKYNNKTILANVVAASNDSLVIGTINNGALLFVQEKLHKQLSIQNGLLSNNITKAKIIDGSIWLLTTKVLEQVTKQSAINHYTLNDDIGFENVNNFCVSDSNIYLALKKNIVIINTHRTNINQPPYIAIDAILVNQKTLTQKNKNTLPYYENNIQFILSGLSFSSGKQLSFKYRLIGVDTNWIISNSAQYVVNFSALLPGKYIFEALAVGVDGNYSNKEKFEFTILQPWWKQWWFIAITFTLALIIVVVIYRNNIKSLRQKNNLAIKMLNLQNDLRESTLTAIKSQMNPHFIFNALNTIQSYIYTNDENKASNYLGKFSDLIRLILDNSQRKAVSLTREIEMLRLYVDLELMRFENTLEATIVVNDNIDTDAIQLPPMLIQPYIENAIKHGLLHKVDNRKLNISFNVLAQENCLQIIIDDNGIGRTASMAINAQRNKSHSSFASFANQHRFELLNQSLHQKINLQIIDKVNNMQQALGTTVIITMPL
jgi:ligand-binding sensor domain-containing protein